MAASSGVDISSANLEVKNNNTEKKNDLLSFSVYPLTTFESALDLATGTPSVLRIVIFGTFNSNI